MEELQLVLHIVVPILAAIFLAARKAQGKGLSRLKGVFHLDANTGLSDQPLFHMGMFIPVFLFASFGWVAWTGYKVELSAEGLDTFIKLSKLPLALLSLIVPIGAIIASFHSTKQTAVQIQITDRKAKLESYYQHRTELFGYFDRLEERRYLRSLSGKFRAHPVLHKRMFIGAPENGSPCPDLKAFHSIYCDIAKASVLLEVVFNATHCPPDVDSYLKACCLIVKCAYQLELDEIYDGPAKDKYKTQVGDISPIGSSVDEHIAALRYLGDYFNSLCDFCGGIKFKPETFSVLMHSPPKNPTQARLSFISCMSFLRDQDQIYSLRS